MEVFVDNIEKLTLDNTNFRKVLFTGPNSQLVVMSLKIGEDIGMEVHHDVDQFIRIEKGEGKAVLDGMEYELFADFAVVVPAGTNHNIINTSETEELKLYTIYSPAEHPAGTVHQTKDDAMAAEHSH